MTSSVGADCGSSLVCVNGERKVGVQQLKLLPALVCLRRYINDNPLGAGRGRSLVPGDANARRAAGLPVPAIPLGGLKVSAAASC